MSFWRQPCCDDTVMQPLLTCPYGWVSVISILDEAPDPPLYGYYVVGAQPTGVFAGHANEFAWYGNGNWQFCAPITGTKTTIDTCDHLCWNGSAWVVVTAGNGSPFLPSLANLGSGSGVVGIGWSGSQLQLRRIRAGSNVSVVTDNDANDIVINAIVPPPSNGEVNLGANVGASGAGVFHGKTGATLNFRRLYSTNPALTIAEDSNRVRFDLSIPAPPTYDVANVGTGGVGLYRDFTGGTFNFYTLNVDTDDSAVFDITLNVPEDRYDVSFKPSLGDLSLFGDALRLYDLGVSTGDLMVFDTDSWVAITPAVANQGAGAGEVLIDFQSLLTLRARTIKAGANISISQDASEITITGAPAGVSSGNNMGTGADGEGLYTGVISGVMQLKRIKAGSDIFLTGETNDIFIAARTAVAGNGITITPGPTNNTFAVTDWSTLLSDAAVGDASWIKSGPPWLIRKAKAGTGISITQNSNDVTFAHALTRSNVGTGVGPLKQWLLADLQAYGLLAGPGMDIQLVGDDIVLSVTSGGGSGGGVAGTALVGQWTNLAAGYALDPWAMTATTVTFNGTTLSVASVTKNGANEEFTFNEVGKYKVSAKATLTTGASQTQHQLWCEVNTGGGWSEVSGSRSWVYTTNEYNDLQTIHTGEFTLNILAAGHKIRFRVITSGGPAAIAVASFGTAVTIEKAVGPIWEVLEITGTTYNMTESDNGKVLWFMDPTPITLNMPDDILTSFACRIIQYDVGKVNFTATGGATINSHLGPVVKTNGQYAVADVNCVRGTGANSTYVISGNIA